MALTAYAKERNIEWSGQVQEYSESAEHRVGRDRIAIAVSNDEKAVEIQSMCGNMGASATANSEDGSVKSSIFSISALERGRT